MNLLYFLLYKFVLQEDVCSANPLTVFQKLEFFCPTLVELGNPEQGLQPNTGQHNRILDTWNMSSSLSTITSSIGPPGGAPSNVGPKWTTLGRLSLFKG